MKNISVVGKNNITMTTEKTVDWTYWESVIDDPVVAEMKALHERAVKEAIDGMSFEDDTSTKAMMADIKEAFEGPDGLVSIPSTLPQLPCNRSLLPVFIAPQFSEGRKAEVAAEAGMAQTIKDLEALESQMTVRQPAPATTCICACICAGACTCTCTCAVTHDGVMVSITAPTAPQNLKEQTIAEVLDSDPQMREEIEEEMKSHQWGA